MNHSNVLSLFCFLFPFLNGSLWLNQLADQAELLLTAWFSLMSHIWHKLVQAEPNRTELSRGNTTYKHPKMWCEVLYLDTHLLQLKAVQLFRANAQCIEVPAMGLVCQCLDFILVQFCGDCYQLRDEIW
jgi:hypothetical protein